MPDEKIKEKCGERTFLNVIGSVYLGVWIISLIVFWTFVGAGDAMGYSIVFFFLAFPVTTFVISFLIGKRSQLGKRRWLLSLAFGVGYMLADYATFSLANMIAFEKFNLPSFEMIIGGAAISLFGMAAGAALGYITGRR